MTPEQAIEELSKLNTNMDIELRHIRADEILCELLSEFNCQGVASEFEKVVKWYA